MFSIDHKGKIPKGKNALLFDGVCVLCDSYTQLVWRRDTSEKILFATLQSEFGQMVSQQLADKGFNDLDSVIMIDDEGRVFIKSDVALKLSSFLGGLWPLNQIFFLIPKLLRDLVYDFVARNRYKWFGKKEACRLPTPEERKRFIE